MIAKSAYREGLQSTIKAFVWRGEDHYVAECFEVAVVTQGKTLDETIANLQEKDCQKLLVWFTEQTPSHHWPKWFLEGMAHVTRRAAQLSFSHPVRDVAMARSWLLKGTRVRLLGEMCYLHTRGILKLMSVFTLSNKRFFDAFGLPTSVVPMGFDQRFGRFMNIHRDIDVVFIGSTKDSRRSRIITDLKSKLDYVGINFVIKYGSPKRGHVFGEQRVALLNRTKIMLNIMRQPWDDPVFRILLAAPNGAFVLSEKVEDAGPFVPTEHFAMTDLTNMVEAIRYYLDHNAERQVIADCAREFVTCELTMTNMVGKLLEELRNSAN